MTEAVRAKYQSAMRGYLVVGAAVSVALAVGLGGWAATSDISGAVIANGQVVVVSEVKKVQHPNGGVVGEILVQEGELVQEGDIVVRLDDTVLKANLAIVTKSIDEFTARRARLIAERDGRSEIAFSDALAQRADEPGVAEILASENRLFELRATAREGNRARLKERIDQLGQLVTGLNAQVEAKSSEIDLIQQELDAARALWKKKLIQLARLTALEREAVSIAGLRAELVSRIAETKGRVAETELQILQIDRDFFGEVAKELREIDGRIGELVERKVTAEDQLKRIELKAPATGIVHQSQVHTVGGVISPGEAVMLIVPANDELEVEAKISPRDIDQLHIGAQTMLRFTAFNQRTTPELTGRLERISADVSTEERSGTTYYKARVKIDGGQLGLLGDLKLVPGMPADVFVRTADRKVISLLLKPFSDQLFRAFRED